MIRSEEHWLSVVDSFQAAAVGEHGWDVAVQRLAGATGSRSAQLAGVHCGTRVVFNTMTNIDPAFPKLFAETIDINPRVVAAHNTPVLKVISDWDCMTPEAYQHDRYCQEVLQPFDIPWFCLTTLGRSEGALVGLVLIRSHREGHITAEQRRVFGTIAPHVRTAVRTHIALQGQSIALLTQAMETLSIPLFVCERGARVVALTRVAETLVTDGNALQITQGRLQASQLMGTRMLKDAIDAAASALRRPGPPVSRTVIIGGRDSQATPVVLDVFPLPSRSDALGLTLTAPRVLVVVRGTRGAGGTRAAILRALYGLTSAEAEIALHLAKGKTAQAIATQRGVTVGTVRTQIKAILGRVGVRRQVELMARLNQF